MQGSQRPEKTTRRENLYSLTPSILATIGKTTYKLPKVLFDNVYNHSCIILLNIMPIMIALKSENLVRSDFCSSLSTTMKQFNKISRQKMGKFFFAKMTLFPDRTSYDSRRKMYSFVILCDISSPSAFRTHLVHRS